MRGTAVKIGVAKASANDSVRGAVSFRKAALMASSINGGIHPVHDVAGSQVHAVMAEFTPSEPADKDRRVALTATQFLNEVAAFTAEALKARDPPKPESQSLFERLQSYDILFMLVKSFVTFFVFIAVNTVFTGAKDQIFGRLEKQKNDVKAAAAAGNRKKVQATPAEAAAAVAV